MKVVKFIRKISFLVMITMLFNTIIVSMNGKSVIAEQIPTDKIVQNSIVQEETSIENNIVQPEKYDMMQPDQYDLEVTIRDFKMDHILFQYDQYKFGSHVLLTDTVEKQLGTDKNPVISKKGINNVVYGNNQGVWSGKGLAGQYNEIYNQIAYNTQLTTQERNEILNRLGKLRNRNTWTADIGTYEDAQEWYGRVKDMEYTTLNALPRENRDSINTAYRYAYYFTNAYFRDVNTINVQPEEVQKTITLNKKQHFDSTYSYCYENYSFFPVNNMGFGNQGNTDSYGNSKNFHYSLESHSKFYLEDGKDLEFNFLGDDDVWAYINNELVIDLGGIHSKESASFKIKYIGNGKAKIISSANKDIILDTNKWYDFDFFYMERNTTESNFKLETNIEFKPQADVTKTAYIIENNEERDLQDGDIVYPGQTVYYKFLLKNNGNVDFTNINFKDDLLNLKIDNEGVTTLDGHQINYEDITIKKNENNTQSCNGLQELEQLASNGSIEIKSTDFLKKVITEDDLDNIDGTREKHIINTVIATVDASVEGIGSKTCTDKDTAEVVVKDLDNEYVDIGIEKTVDSIKRGNDFIYNSSIPGSKQQNIKPNDIVNFKFTIKNNSKINGNPVALDDLVISDALDIGNVENIKTQWEFKNEDGSKFNGGRTDGITIGANEEIVIYAQWKVSYDEANNYEYTLEKDVTNTVTIKKNNKEFTSYVMLKIEPVNLIIEKNIVDELGNINNSIDEDRYFTIKVKGSDEKEYIVEVQAGKKYILENLRYGAEGEGVNYTTSEIVPMNYEQVGIENEISTLESSNEIVTVKNKKINDSYFFDDISVANKFGNYIP